MIRFVFATVFAVLTLAQPLRAETDIQEVTTPGGITAWLVEEHSIPFVALEIMFRGGAVTDPPDQLGVTNLMSALLEEGAGDLDAREFAKARDALATTIRFRLNRDELSVSARFLTETRDESLDLLRTALMEPRFDEDAIERVRAQVLSSLQSDLKDPEAIASLGFDRMIYGDHPYGKPADGTIESVSGLTRADLIAAHQRALTREGVYVAAVGDITAEELGIALDKLLAGLPEALPDLPGPVDPNLPGGVMIEDFETPQSVVRFAQPGISRDDPDFFAAFVLNHILGGGGFESQLMNEVREKRGLTYGIYSYLAIPDYAQLWAGGTATANGRVAETIQVIRDVWNDLRENGVTAEQLEDAKTYLTGAYPLRFDGNGPIARIAVNMQFDDLPLDYIATRNDKVNAVTLEQINRVAQTLLDPDKLTFYVVGQPEGLESTVN
jgi:zinc protease